MFWLDHYFMIFSFSLSGNARHATPSTVSLSLLCCCGMYTALHWTSPACWLVAVGHWLVSTPQSQAFPRLQSRRSETVTQIEPAGQHLHHLAPLHWQVKLSRRLVRKKIGGTRGNMSLITLHCTGHTPDLCSDLLKTDIKSKDSICRENMKMTTFEKVYFNKSLNRSIWLLVLCFLVHKPVGFQLNIWSRINKNTWKWM